SILDPISGANPPGRRAHGAPDGSSSSALRPVRGRAPPTRADESRSDSAAAQRARREARIRVERAAHGGDDASPLMPHETTGDPGCLSIGDRPVQRAVRPGARTLDAEVAEHMADA